MSVSHLILMAGALTAVHFACSDRAPLPEANSGSQKHIDQELADQLQADQALIKASYLSALAQDPSPIRSWEKSEGMIAFFQSHLTKAREKLLEELKASPQATTLQVGFCRVNLELVEVYERLALMERHVLPSWLSYERSRPNSAPRYFWYSWLEFVAQQGQSSIQQDSLLKNLQAQPQGHSWVQFALDLQSEVPDVPQRTSASYRRWVKFARAVQRGDLEAAETLWPKLKTHRPMFTLKGETRSEKLKIFDPRVTPSLKEFHAHTILKRCSSIVLSAYYQGRAYEALGEQAQAVSAYRRAITQLDQRLAISISERQDFDQLVLSPHLKLSQFYDEITARLARLGTPLKPLDANRLPHLASDRPLHAQSSEKSISATTESPIQLSTSAAFWKRLAQSPESLETPSPLLPHRKPALNLIIANHFEELKGEGRNLVLSLELPHRWLDELHDQYASVMIHQDHRTSAIKTLNAVEEARLNGRIVDENGSGHNRLKRLLLSAYTYLKLNQQRTTIKYLRRLKKHLPALSFVLGMTSDVLSGKSFEQKHGHVNSGQ